jgi:peptidoglycan/xylan/chitin deacetylase (PgdA/CDA1 family)
MYHGVTNERAFNEVENHSNMHVSAPLFSQQMRFLSNRHNVLRLSDFVKHLRDGSAFPRHSVVITFDDGYENNYTEAFPVLQKYGIPATLFLSTRFIGKEEMFWSDRLELIFRSPECRSRLSKHLATIGIRDTLPTGQLDALIKYCKKIDDGEKEALISRLEELSGIDGQKRPHDFRCLTWEQVREMCASRLIEVGSHTHNHVIMTRVDPERAREEICMSRDNLRENLSVTPTLFSYPNGALGDYDETSQSLLLEHGFECALLTEEDFNTGNSAPYELRRIGVYNSTSLVEFEARVSGFHFVALKLFRKLVFRANG